MNKDNNEPAAAPDALQAFTDCPEWGVGGQFTYDPVTKQRTRVGDIPAPAGTANAVLEAPTTSITAESASKKERNRA